MSPAITAITMINVNTMIGRIVIPVSPVAAIINSPFILSQ